MKTIESISKFEGSIAGKVIIVIIPTIVFYGTLVLIKKTEMEAIIMTHKILIATIIFSILIISFLIIYDVLNKAIIQLLTINKIEKKDRELSDKILKNQIDYNLECIKNHISGNPIKDYNPIYTEEMKKLHEDLNKELIQNSL